MEATAYIYRRREQMLQQQQTKHQKLLFHSRSTTNLLKYYKLQEKIIGVLASEQITKANRPFAQSDHMVRNELCLDASYMHIGASKTKEKEHSHLEIAELIEPSGWAKQKEI